MSMYHLMNNTAAQDIFLDIPANAHPADLADQYKLARLAQDTPRCVALEEHVRQLAQIHFDKPAVLDALTTVERYKTTRIPGRRAPRYMQAIADAIEEQYKRGAHTLAPDGRAQFRVDTTTIRCQNAPGAVAWLVAKYRKGLPSRTLRK